MTYVAGGTTDGNAVPMPPAIANHPSGTFIIPILNTEAILEICLTSIAWQTYPREKMEIILADAHSTDRTREIAKNHGALILNDDGKNMEEGKRLALRHATGEFIVFVDADNEITHADYLELAIKALAANPAALGVESYYLPSSKISSFCAYITHLLHISDPIAWLMSANAWGVLTYKRRRNDKGNGGQSLIAELQVKQTLKKITCAASNRRHAAKIRWAANH